jgi:diphosphomevalonate decarboxylase
MKMENKWLSEAFKGSVPDGFRGKVGWQSPSNIALVKYWGKKGKQIPQNPSISFTLSECRSETCISFEKADRFDFGFFFECKENPAFGAKIEKFLLEYQAFFPFINQLNLKVESRNTFPHSSGIASSASSMSAFVMCLIEIEHILTNLSAFNCVECTAFRQAQRPSLVEVPEPVEGPINLQKASYFSRLASGSAARSVFPKMALWGATACFDGSSDEFAVSLENDIHPVFKTYRDSILIVSGETKSVSSRAGHALMEGNPYAPARYAQANENIKNLLAALKSGDLDTFINITESEALQLHALMMCSNPSYILMKPNTLNLINEIRHFREETKIPLCFTLDAGPNVHLLYPEKEADRVVDFIQSVLVTYCNEGRWIADSVGDGPKKLL